MLRRLAWPALAPVLVGACAPKVMDANRYRSHEGPAVDCPAGTSQTMAFGRNYITAMVIRCQVVPVFDVSSGLLTIDIDGTMGINGRHIGRWPGGTVARRRPGVGEEVVSLGEPVKTIVDLRLHGAPAVASFKVRFQRVRPGQLGDELVFDVAMSGAESDAGMCHQWTSEAHATGELVLRASDGSLLELRLRGPMSDTEALCPEGAKETGVSAEPKTCNRGEMTFWLTSRCYRVEPMSGATKSPR